MERRTVEYNGEQIEVIFPDREWFVQKYDELASTVFSGLSRNVPPVSDVNIVIDNRMKNAQGMAGFTFSFSSKNSFRKKTGFNIYSKFTIAMKARWMLPEWSYTNTLCHEMLHIALFNNGEMCGHTGPFLSVAKEILDRTEGKINIEQFVPEKEAMIIGKRFMSQSEMDSNARKEERRRQKVKDAMELLSDEIYVLKIGLNDTLDMDFHDWKGKHPRISYALFTFSDFDDAVRYYRVCGAEIGRPINETSVALKIGESAAKLAVFRKWDEDCVRRRMGRLGIRYVEMYRIPSIENPVGQYGEVTEPASIKRCVLMNFPPVQDGILEGKIRITPAYIKKVSDIGPLFSGTSFLAKTAGVEKIAQKWEDGDDMELTYSPANRWTTNPGERAVEGWELDIKEMEEISEGIFDRFSAMKDKAVGAIKAMFAKCREVFNSLWGELEVRKTGEKDEEGNDIMEAWIS